MSSSAPKIGLLLLTALVTGNMIGSGIFLLPASLASFGSIGLVAWVFTAVGAIFLALVFAQLSRMIPKTGGPYAYCRKGFGDCIGFLVAYNYWIAVWVGNAAIVVACVGYLGVFWPELAHNNVLALVVSLIILWSITLVNISGIRKAGVLQLLTTIFKILPLLAVAVVGVFFIHPHNFTPFNVSGLPTFSALTAAASVTLWSFIGLESATVPADAVADPQRTMSRATIIGTCIAAFIYISSTAVVMGVMPLSELARSTAPFSAAAEHIFGHTGALLIGIGAVISCLGALNGWILLAGQIPMAAARDNIFPALYAKQNAQGVPVNGLIVSSILVSGLLLLTLHEELVKQFTFIILMATLSSLIPYFFTTMAELMLLFQRRDEFSPKRLFISSVIAIIAGLYAFWTIIGSGHDVVYYGFLLTLMGLPIYVWVRWRNFDRVEAEQNIQEIISHP